MMASENMHLSCCDDVYWPNLDDIHVEEHKGRSFEQGDAGSQGGRTVGRKRKALEGLDSIHELLSQLAWSTNEHLEKLSQMIGYEFDMGKAKKQVFEMITTFQGLSMDQVFSVCEILAPKTE